ncbi:hypothetical protein RHMOL_Rhmol13G0266400 [Rhododendron molle]|uniref:Uncharacterized protein n=1 Tax=Rhododendron molle TaxID=49168 RepID=A0ACC0LB10_RHOML|nr:hypothetical protein RHMOL_Rhmol13G0266400 [Rhododendron molle]
MSQVFLRIELHLAASSCTWPLTIAAKCNSMRPRVIRSSQVQFSAARDPELLRKIGEATALEVRAAGIPYAFAPCIAVCRDPRWGRCYESYSEDHRIVQAMTEIIPGLQGDLPANSQHGVPLVGGKYETTSLIIVSLLYEEKSEC